MKNLSTVAKGVGLSFFGILSAQVLVYVFNIVLTRSYSAFDVGLFKLGQSIIFMLAPLAIWGVSQGVLRFLSMYKSETGKARGIILFAIRLCLSTSFIITVILIIFSKFIANDIFHIAELAVVIKLFAVGFPFFILLRVFNQIAYAYKKPVYKVLLGDLARNVAIIGFVVVFAVLKFKIEGAIYAFILSVFVPTIIYLLVLKKITPLFNLGVKPVYITKEVLRYSLPLLFSTIIIAFDSRMGDLFVGYFLGPEDVAVYSIAIRVAVSVSIGLHAVNAIFSPMIASLHKQGKITDLSSLYKTMTKWVFMLSFPALLIIFLFSREILSLFGQEFIAGSTVLLLLGVAQFINTATGSSGYMVSMIGKSKVHFVNQVVILGANLVLNIILISRFGIIGAAISYAMSIALLNILQLVEVYYFLRIVPYKLSLMRVFTVGLLAFAATYFLPFFWVVNLAIFAVVYLCLIAVIGFEAEEKYLLRLTLMRLKIIKS